MRLVYFFVPVVEPLGLPDGFVFQFTRSESYEEWLRKDAVAHVEPSEDPILVASLKFWRSKATTSDPGGVATLFEVAAKAFPDVLPPSGSAEPLAQERTVVEVAVPLATDDEDALTDAFEVGLANLRNFQRAYHLVGGKHPITLASRERMPVFIPFAVRNTDHGDDNWPSEVSLFLLNTNLFTDVRLPDLTDEQLSVLSSAVESVTEAVGFHGYPEGVREARLALERDGDYRAAVLLAAIAAETFLDDLLAHALWEEGVRPEDAAVTFDRGYLATRIKREYPSRFGGSWALDGSGPIAEWSTRLARIRNRIIHAGYEPDGAVARAAHEALMGLETFVTERLTAAGTLKSYPRTALAVLGEPGLRRRGKWSRRIEELTKDPNEPDWRQTFNRWRAAMGRHREESHALDEKPDVARAVVLRCIRGDGRAYWCAHDRATFVAGLLPSPPNDVIPTVQSANMAKVEAEVRERGESETISIALFGVEPWAVPVEWRPEYRLVPLAGVMITGNDLDDDAGDD